MEKKYIGPILIAIVTIVALLKDNFFVALIGMVAICVIFKGCN